MIVMELDGTRIVVLKAPNKKQSNLNEKTTQCLFYDLVIKDNPQIVVIIDERLAN